MEQEPMELDEDEEGRVSEESIKRWDSSANCIQKDQSGRLSDDASYDKCNRFIGYNNSVKRLNKNTKKKNSKQLNEVVTKSLSKESEMEEKKKQREEKLARLLECLKGQNNKITLWQSFDVFGVPLGVVFCYEKDRLRMRVNLEVATFGHNFQIILTEDRLELTTQMDKSDVRWDKSGVSRLKVTRAYKVPSKIDYDKAVCEQNGNILDVSVPWRLPPIV